MGANGSQLLRNNEARDNETKRYEDNVVFIGIKLAVIISKPQLTPSHRF